MFIGLLLWGFRVQDNFMTRPALARATYFWISTIPLHGLSWLFLGLFYKFGHVWTSRGVVVGFEFDDSLVEEENRKWQEKAVGKWVVPYHDGEPKMVDNKSNPNDCHANESNALNDQIQQSKDIGSSE